MVSRVLASSLKYPWKMMGPRTQICKRWEERREAGRKTNESWEEGKKGGEREGGRLAGREQQEKQQ
jgi:hypothetical protein